MDKTMSSSLRLFSILLSLLVHLVEKSNSLTFELINPHSPDSPFYKPNLTRSDMIEMFSSRPRIRGKSPGVDSSNTTNSDLHGVKVFSPVLENTDSGFLVKLNLGNFPNDQPSYKTYYFHFDTGSQLTWLQCEDCTKPGGLCFDQLAPPYPNSKSRTYNPLPCDRHQLCSPGECLGQFCSYNIKYDEDSHSIGFLAYEDFTFSSSYTHQAVTAKIVFGCGFHNNLALHDESCKEVGILGMGWGPLSFVNQIYTHSHGRFSYCFPPVLYDGRERSSGILRFGSDIPTHHHHLHALPIQKYWGDSTYYATLQDISINDRRLNIPARYFAKTSPDKGGCIFDTGTTYTYISRPAYKILKEEMIKHLAVADTSLKIRGSKKDYDLCFWRYRPFKGYYFLPTVTFHFAGGADLVLQRDIAFVAWSKPNTDTESVCLLIMPSSHPDDVSIIGAQSQANHLVMYDLPAQLMHFGPRNCAQNP